MIAGVLAIASVVAQGRFSAAVDRWLKNRLTTTAGQLIVTNKGTFAARILVAQIFAMAKGIGWLSSDRALRE